MCWKSSLLHRSFFLDELRHFLPLFVVTRRELEGRLSLKSVILLPSSLFPREWGKRCAQTGSRQSAPLSAPLGASEMSPSSTPLELTTCITPYTDGTPTLPPAVPHVTVPFPCALPCRGEFRSLHGCSRRWFKPLCFKPNV